jgi:hypothetical protein
MARFTTRHDSILARTLVGHAKADIYVIASVARCTKFMNEMIRTRLAHRRNTVTASALFYSSRRWLGRRSGNVTIAVLVKHVPGSTRRAQFGVVRVASFTSRHDTVRAIANVGQTEAQVLIHVVTEHARRADFKTTGRARFAHGCDAITTRALVGHTVPIGM